MRWFVWLMAMLIVLPAAGQERLGFFRDPALHGDTLVFVAEGDLWRVDVEGGPAQRLTAHTGKERAPRISVCGNYVAFAAEYEGPVETFVIPIEGGRPERLTFEPNASVPVSWTLEGRVVYTTSQYSTLPRSQLAAVSRDGTEHDILPLSQAADGVYDDRGERLFFVRPSRQSSSTRNYEGGRARNIWRFDGEGKEAVNLTEDHPGEHYNPMWWDGRVYFISERSGTRNLWSMKPDGGDKAQLTFHERWDVRQASISGGRVAYQRGADIHLLDLDTRWDRVIPIELVSDFDQLRERWVGNPMSYFSSANIHPDGESVALTLRGRVFVAPAGQGRIVRASREEGVRYRDAVFMPDGETLLALSDKTGELEFHTLPVRGLGEPEAITDDGSTIRFQAYPSPDGKRIAYTDRERRLWVMELETDEKKKASTNQQGVGDLAWAPCSHWLAFGQTASNTYRQIWLYDVDNDESHAITTDRVNSLSPSWDPDGEWLYFLSDRDLRSLVTHPWGPRQPEPYFDEVMRIYKVALQSGLRSPFKPDDELMDLDEEEENGNGGEEEPEENGDKEDPGDNDEDNGPIEVTDRDGDNDKEEDKDKDRDNGKKEKEDARKDEKDKDTEAKEEKDEDANGDEEEAEEEERTVIEFDGMERRVHALPLPSGNYGNLTVNSRALFFTDRDSGRGGGTHLAAVRITNDSPSVNRIVTSITKYRLAQEGDHILIRRGGSLFIIRATGSSPGNLSDHQVSLSGLSFSLDVREDWRQIYMEAWRNQRDIFYDPDMHGLDWEAKRDKYLPLVDRVTTREELNEVISMLMAELSALHINAYGGDIRRDTDGVSVATLGAYLERDEDASGYRIARIYEADPDYPEWFGPLREPGLDIEEGEVITAINGTSTLSARHPNELLRNQQGQQVLLELGGADGNGETRERIVRPTTNESLLRYRDWKYSRRVAVEEASDNRLGYIHLSAMGGANLGEWYREFYPVFNREGIIIDMRANRGGNIDSIILGKLLREAWSYHQERAMEPSWNMQYAFRGHTVVLVDETTSSNGEGFTEGFQRLGLGTVIGTRTWGGYIWIAAGQTVLSDGGNALAPHMGVYSEDGEWIIERHGVEPDITVDNLPHATFKGEDAQLDAAIEYLLDKLEEEPVEVPQPPPYPHIDDIRF